MVVKRNNSTICYCDMITGTEESVIRACVCVCVGVCICVDELLLLLLSLPSTKYKKKI